MTTVCQAVEQPTIAPISSGADIGLVPTGTYKISKTKQELLDQGVGTVDAANNAGDWTWHFDGATGWWSIDHPNGYHEVCNTAYVDAGDRITVNMRGGGWFDFRWTLDGDQLAVTILNTSVGTPADVA